MHSTFIPFCELPEPIQERAMTLFISTYGLTMTEAVALAYEELAREGRARRYLTKHSASFRQAKNGVLVPSESRVGEWYLVTPERCSCPARGDCKHFQAVALWMSAQSSPVTPQIPDVPSTALPWAA